MNNTRTLVVLAAALLLSSRLVFADTAVALSATDASILERLAALERRFDELSAENRDLRAQLAAATAAPAPAQPAPARPAKPEPVYVTAAGKEKKFALGGFLHLNAESGGAPDARWAGINDRFLVRRARLNATGSFAEDFSYKVEADFGANSISARSGYGAQLTDLFAAWTPSTLASVRIGQFKTPFGYEQLLSDTKTPTVERALSNDRLTMSRQIGASLSGDLLPGRLAYSAGLFNGNGVNNSNNDDDDFLWAGRVNGTIFTRDGDATPLRLDAGLNAFSTSLAGTTTQRDGVGVDLQFTWGPAILAGEWLQNSYETTTAAGDFDAAGWSVLALLNVTKRWQLVGRIDTFEADTSTAGTTTDEWTLGANYLINGDHLKISLNYLNGTIDGVGSDNRLLGRLQVMY